MDMNATEKGFRAISADSHVVEPPDCFSAHIEAKYKDSAPKIVRDDASEIGGETVVIPGMPSVPLAIVAAAGLDPKEIKLGGKAFDEIHRGAWDPKARIADQDRDGVAGEVIYPSTGMVLCNHSDADYKHACSRAYNRWLAEFVGGAPNRLFGLGMTGVRSVADAIEDFRQIKLMGFKGVMLPGSPCTEEDYDHPCFDPLWEAAVELNLPISFHVLAAGDKAQSALVRGGARGPKIASWQAVIRSCQDIIGMFIFGRVFERHPGLKLVCVEADAGWVPHFMYRMDHAYKRHRYWLKCDEMKRLPSEYFSDHVYVTFQDDWVAFKMAGMCNARRLMWANDFPHSDSTWPHSQALLAQHSASLSHAERGWILHDNVRDLYDLHL
jgi:predicted TIM-barrel fold metal-dependent hydrolase